jgi:hypothetical protein
MIEIEPNWWALGALSVLLAGLHPIFPAIDRHIRRHEALSIGLIGGIALSYVVLYLLPKIAAMNGAAYGRASLAQLALYLVLLASIVIYLGMLYLDRIPSGDRRLPAGFDYFVHGTYSVLIGYVFVELAGSNAVRNALIGLILGIHLLGMNHVLRAERTIGFDRFLRWIFCGLLLAGTAAGLTTEVPPAVISTVTAFLGGIILVNVIAEELPLHHQERLPWFVVGVLFYLVVTSLIFLLEAGS